LFLDHNCQTTNPKKRALKKRIQPGFYVKKETKNCPWGWGPAGPDECGPIESINLPLCDVTHKSTQIQNLRMFLNRNWKTSRIRKGFEQFSSFIGRQVMTGQSQSYCSDFAIPKGF